MLPILRLLGLAQRAGNVVSGDESVRAKLQRRQVKLVIIAEDAAATTRQDFVSLARKYGVPHVFCGTKEKLGAAIGKSPRAVLALLDENLAHRVAGYLNQETDQ